MKFREITKLALEDGWYLVHTAGSHRQYKHLTKAGRVTIAGKPGRRSRRYAKEYPEAGWIGLKYA
jgi:predicted RNA binding protein YcfA (HicA-like mRNA interferase family)